MVVISSRMTKFYKYVFPTIWFGFLAFFFSSVLTLGAARESPMALVVPGAMALFGYFLFRKVLWVLVDEVRDGGDFLVVRNRSEEITVYLSSIINVSVSTNTNPPQVTLRLAQPGKFGSELVFSPAQRGFSLNPFRKNPIVEDLIVRVDKARRAQAPPPGPR
jgi:hypothetical protein